MAVRKVELYLGRGGFAESVMHLPVGRGEWGRGAGPSGVARRNGAHRRWGLDSYSNSNKRVCQALAELQVPCSVLSKSSCCGCVCLCTSVS